jgi:hypothetical protein
MEVGTRRYCAVASKPRTSLVPRVQVLSYRRVAGVSPYIFTAIEISQARTVREMYAIVEGGERDFAGDSQVESSEPAAILDRVGKPGKIRDSVCHSSGNRGRVCPL